MNNLELIDCLCAVIEKQSAIIRKQAFFIEEQLTVDEETKRCFEQEREAIDDKLNVLGMNLRPICNTDTQKGERNDCC